MSRGASPDCRIDSLEHGLFLLDDWDQRSLRFVSWIEALIPEDAAPVFEDILLGACHHRTAKLKVLAEAAMLALLDGSWCEEHRIHTREAAAALGMEVTNAFLLVPEPVEEDDPRFDVPDYGGGRPLLLGERRSLASRPSRQVIARALLDPHPLVVLRLLANPKVTEADVLRIASRRPAPPAVLAQVARHVRWRGRTRVAAALTHNPWSPHVHALSLLPGLPRALIGEIAEDKLVPDLLRLACRILLSGKQRSR